MGPQKIVLKKKCVQKTKINPQTDYFQTEDGSILSSFWERVATEKKEEKTKHAVEDAVKKITALDGR
jgi:hypothetical protein